MQQRPLGQSGLKASALGFGAGHIGGDGASEPDIGRLLNLALDLGVTFFDTARGYGRSEERIGRHLAHRRGEFVLASKCGYGIEGVEDWTPEAITRGVDEALARLNTDYLDVMLLHSCPRHVLDRPGLIEALERAVSAGKVRVAGYSGENEDLAYALASGRFGVLECSINPFDQRSIAQILPEAFERGIGVIAKRPLGNVHWRFHQRPEGDYAETYWLRMQAMGLQPDPYGWEEFALRFACFFDGVGTGIAGTANAAHLRRNVEAVSRGPLPAAIVQATREAFARHDTDWIGQV